MYEPGDQIEIRQIRISPPKDPKNWDEEICYETLWSYAAFLRYDGDAMYVRFNNGTMEAIPRQFWFSHVRRRMPK